MGIDASKQVTNESTPEALAPSTERAAMVKIDREIAETATAYHRAVNTYEYHLRQQEEAEQRSGREPSPYSLTQTEEARGKAEAALIIWQEANTQYGGWSRFYLVDASNGHIHSTTSCSTCFPTTQFGWLTDLSGLTEAEAVEVYGGILCSVCYKSVRVEWTEGTNKVDAARKEAEKWLKAASRIPSVKKAQGKRSQLRSLGHNLESARENAQRAQERLDENDSRDTAEDDARGERTLDENNARVAKAEKQIARANKALAALEADEAESLAEFVALTGG